MSGINGRLLRLLPTAVRTLNAAGAPSVLIGGVAVHLRCAELSDPVDLDETDPRRIASIIRGTDDLDLVVGEPQMQRAVDALLASSFVRSKRMRPPPIRMQRGGDVIDLIARRPTTRAYAWADLESVLPSVELECTPVRVDGEEVVVASSDMLVVLKAVAWTNRYAEHDLVDVARIAILDRSEGAVASALTQRATTLPGPVLSSVRALYSAFERDGSAGPAAIASASRAELPGLRHDDDLELEIRALARDAVRAMLRHAVE